MYVFVDNSSLGSDLSTAVYGQSIFGNKRLQLCKFDVLICFDVLCTFFPSKGPGGWILQGLLAFFSSLDW